MSSLSLSLSLSLCCASHTHQHGARMRRTRSGPAESGVRTSRRDGTDATTNYGGKSMLCASVASSRESKNLGRKGAQGSELESATFHASTTTDAAQNATFGQSTKFRDLSGSSLPSPSQPVMSPLSRGEPSAVRTGAMLASVSELPGSPSSHSRQIFEEGPSASPPRPPPRMRLDPFFRNHAFLGTFGSYRNGKIVANDYLKRGIVALDQSIGSNKNEDNNALMTAAAQWQRLSRTSVGGLLTPTSDSNMKTVAPSMFRLPLAESPQIKSKRDTPNQTRRERIGTMELLTLPSTAVATCADYVQDTSTSLLSESSQAGSPGSAISISSTITPPVSHQSLHRNYTPQKLAAMESFAGVDPSVSEREDAKELQNDLPNTIPDSMKTLASQHDQRESVSVFIPNLCPWLPLPRDDPYVGFLRHSPLSQQFCGSDKNNPEGNHPCVNGGMVGVGVGEEPVKKAPNQSHNAAELWAQHLIHRKKKAEDAKKKDKQDSDTSGHSNGMNPKKGYSLTGLIDILWEVPCDPDFAVTRVAFSRHKQWERRHLTKCMLRRIPVISFGEHYQCPKTKPEIQNEMNSSDSCFIAIGDSRGDPNGDGEEENAEEDALVLNVEDSLSEGWEALSRSSIEGNASEERTEDKKKVSSNFSPIPIPHQTSCSICRLDFEHGEKLRVLPCKHLFHKNCVDQWLLGSRSAPDMHTNCCPLCKADVGCNGQPDESLNTGQSQTVQSKEKEDLFGDCSVTGIPIRCFMKVGYEQWMNATRQEQATESIDCDEEDPSDGAMHQQHDLARPLATSQEVTVVTLRLGGARSARMRRQLWNLNGGPPRIRLLSTACRAVLG